MEQMLTSLIIENFAIVSKLEIDFKDGFSVFTGETGAGKSIMIDALCLVLGGRADPVVVRSGCEKCDIQAAFIYTEDNQEKEAILRRVIFAEGRSKSYLNGELLPLQKIKDFSEALVNIHGQHHYQTLLHNYKHREQLDAFAGHHELVESVSQAWRKCQEIQQQILQLENCKMAEDKRLLLQYQLDELLQLNLQPEEVSKLNQDHILLSNAQNYLDIAEQIQEILYGDNKSSICSQLHQVTHLLSQLSTKDITTNQGILELLNNTLIQCEEAHDEIRHFINKIEINPERLELVESRINLLHQIAKKHRIEVAELTLFQERLQKDLAIYEDSQAQYQKLSLQYQVANQEYIQACELLSKSRHKSAQKNG